MKALGELNFESSLKNPVQEASSESTKIEQARTFAEVAMQVDLAKKYPRNLDQVFKRIDETFERSPSLLLKSKWDLPRGGQKLTGYTIQFARAIAECVGNIKYSFRELSRDKKQSEVLVYAWDMETNTIQDRTFIVPHTRDIKGGKKKPLLHERDIYENNANMGARRLRECILDVLPAAARRRAEETVERLLQTAYPEGKLKEYSQKAISAFAAWNITSDQIIKERGNRPPEVWTRNDILALSAHVEDLKNGDKQPGDIFEFVQNIKVPNPSSPKTESKKPTPLKSDSSKKEQPETKQDDPQPDEDAQFLNAQADNLEGDPGF